MAGYAGSGMVSLRLEVIPLYHHSGSCHHIGIILPMPERTVLSLRLPTDLHDALRKRAEEEGRSLNNYIVRVLLQDEQRKIESQKD